MSQRPPAVAGLFYPAEPDELRENLIALLSAAPAMEHRPKALVVPHAGYEYSGPVAASAYVRLRGDAGIERVLLLGSSHRVAYAGLALPEADSFLTPLGEIFLEKPDLEGREGFFLSDAAHAREHSLEVQLPFLQHLLGSFRLLPVLAGDAEPETLAAFLEEQWGGEETLVLVSTDLSHFLDYKAARHMDAETCHLVESLDDGPWDPRRACGSLPLRALLRVARRRGMRVETLDLRNSGDTAGGQDTVVGYGSWALDEQEA